MPRMISAFCLVVMFFFSFDAAAWAADYEFDWGKGLTREEWYDPSDWFDTDKGIQDETHWYENIYGYDDPYDYYKKAPAPGDGNRTDAAGSDGGTGYDYYTGDWFADRGTFDEWHPDRERTRVIEGKIERVRTVRLGGIGESHRIARVRTAEDDQDGVVVDLGPESALGPMNPEKGDRLTIGAVRGSINEKPVWMATWVRAERETFRIPRSEGRNLKRLDVRVVRTRTVSFREREAPEQLFARVRIANSDVRTIVNLGPVENLPEGLDLEGKTVRMLVRQARIGDKNALIAEAFRVDGQSVDLNWNQRR